MMSSGPMRNSPVHKKKLAWKHTTRKNGKFSKTEQQADVPMAVNGQRVTFMDLPVEIRTQIYGYLLGEDKAIGLEIRTYTPRRHTRIGVKYDRKRTWTHHKEKDTWTRKELKHTSILAINRQIYEEAQGVLYGVNSFYFRNICHLRDFIRMVGERTQYIRHVRLGRGCIKSTGAEKTFGLLCAAGGLRKLELYRCDLYRCPSPWHGNSVPMRKIAERVGPLLSSLEKSWQKRGLNGSVWDVIGLHGNCQECNTKRRIGTTTPAPETFVPETEFAETNRLLIQTFHAMISKTFNIAR